MEREESIEQSRLKGDLQMQNLIDADLVARIRLPDQEDLEVKLGGRTMRFEREEVKRQIDQLRDQKYLDGRMVFRERLHDLALQAHQSSDGTAAFVQRAEIDLSAVDNLVDRIWPQLTPPQYLRELLNSRDRLLEAAGSGFSAHDVRLLHRSRAERLADEIWSDSDIALLDYVEHRLRGHQQYVHLVVDEAQDLSPMQLLMLANRSRRGSATVLGDIAQSTGAWARDDWNDVIAILGKGGPHSIHPLQYGYRVPREVYEYAARLLPSIAPGVVPPEVIRDVGRDPEVREINSGGTGAEVAEVVKSYSATGLYIGVICPRSRWGDVAGAFTDKEMQFWDSESEELVQGQNINLIDPVAAKGLEFDAVVVVEPSAIVEEYERGDRLLYVALTRTMKYLTVVHELPLPASLQDDLEANALADRYDTDGLDPGGAGAGNDRIKEPLPVEVVPTDTVPVLSGPVSIWAERLAQTIDQHLSSQHHSALLIDVIRQLGVEDLVAGRLLADRQTGTLSAESAESADTRQSAAAEWPDLDTPMSVGRGGLHDSWLEGYGYWACHQMKPWREIKLPFGSLRSALFGPSGARALFAGSTKKMRDKVDSHGPVEVVVVRLGDVAVVTDGSLVVSVPWLEVSRSNPDAIVSLVGSTPGRRNLNEASFT